LDADGLGTDPEDEEPTEEGLLLEAIALALKAS